ncbi:hypothetical protein LTR10_001390 [Elasticomyces elasticus]|nr:hypothetical protein LTR10_001390 [Elasticomyces elasticus]KAK4974891.1 hypothetical protein LTR42_004100 [Elasticomyces elasticus]
MADTTSANNVPQVCGVCGTGGVLFKCGCCKCSRYCSKLCQKEDWPVHKKMCKLVTGSKGKKYAVPLGIKPYEGKHPATLVWLKEISPAGHPEFLYSPGFLVESVNDSQFEDLPITRALGFPIGYSPDAIGLQQDTNIPVTQLFVDIDHTSATFGKAKKIPKGGACLARRDGRHISIMHVEALISYAQIANQEIVCVPGREKSGEKVDREEMVKRLLTPKAFAVAFEKLKRDKVMWVRFGGRTLSAPSRSARKRRSRT